MMQKRWTAALAVALMVGGANRCYAGSYSNDFSVDLGAASLRGNAVLDAGSVRLTPNAGSQEGSLVIDDLDPGQAAPGFDASFTIAFGPGSSPPADGISFSFGPPPAGTYGEFGAVEGLAISFDLFQNMGESPPSPAIRVRSNAVQIDAEAVVLFSAGAFRPVVVHYDQSGLDLTYDGTVLLSNLSLPGFVPQPGYQFTFGARTGASSAEQRIDDVTISTSLGGRTAAPAASNGALLILATLLGATAILRMRRRRSRTG